jgi:hypothetical protein
MITVTLSIPDQYGPKILQSYGDELELGRDATQAEVKQEIIRRVVEVVQRRQNERKRVAALAALVPEPTVPIA